MDAAGVHRDSIVIDSLGPDGPAIFTSEMLAHLDKLVGAGASSVEVVEASFDFTQQELLAGRLDEFWDGWKASGVTATSHTLGGFGKQPFSFEAAMRDLALITRRFDAFEQLIKVTKAADVERAHTENRFGVILNFQNTTHFGTDLELLDQFYDLGIRVIQLTYNSRNFVGDGCTERNPSGLSNFGIQVVKRMNELGILVDVSHCSEQTGRDALEVSDRPIAVTHSFARALSDHDRGKSDDLLKLVGQDGYIGVLLVPFFITPEPSATLDHFLDHVEHIANLVGVDHVGIGTDHSAPMPSPLIDVLDKEIKRMGFREEHRVDWAAYTKGFERWEHWPNLTEALLSRFNEDEVRGIIGGNFLRLFREVVG
jgi:membrane dipeptidase